MSYLLTSYIGNFDNINERVKCFYEMLYSAIDLSVPQVVCSPTHSYPLCFTTNVKHNFEIIPVLSYEMEEDW